MHVVPALLHFERDVDRVGRVCGSEYEETHEYEF
jgi:hypothetical protein